jgi:hypothetical protein
VVIPTDRRTRAVARQIRTTSQWTQPKSEKRNNARELSPSNPELMPQNKSYDISHSHSYAAIIQMAFLSNRRLSEVGIDNILRLRSVEHRSTVDEGYRIRNTRLELVTVLQHISYNWIKRTSERLKENKIKNK